MVKIYNCCYSNLRYKEEELGDDITNELTIGTTPTIILSSVNANRKLVKIYSIAYSDAEALLWIRHGGSISIANATFPLPARHLYENTLQASRPLAVVCTSGTALIKLIVVNKL